ncbi:MAG TPA: glycosyltransferase family 1 protein [Nocardioides sp.]|nr:glycosyltransferase family 1 protein [Nocardioides sp.]
MRVLFDGSAFFRHRRSGIGRYFSELVGAYAGDPGLGVTPVLPYRYITNAQAGRLKGVHSLPLPRRFRDPVLGRLNAAPARAAQRAGHDVVHYPLYDEAFLDAAREQRSATTVYDFTFELMPELFGDQSRELALKKEFLAACDVLFCISEATARDLKQVHPHLDQPVVTTPLAVGEEFRGQHHRPRSLPERYLLHVGNRVEHKNVDLIFRSFADLVKTDPTLHLVLSGQGMADEAERLESFGIADRTRVVRLSDRDLPGAYQHAQAFVFPSRYEGFGLPLVEAMAAGTPCVISDAPALLEVAGEAADVVDPDDAAALTATLERLLGDDAFATRRRSEGRARAAEFTWRRTAELTVDGYRAALQA